MADTSRRGASRAVLGDAAVVPPNNRRDAAGGAPQANDTCGHNGDTAAETKRQTKTVLFRLDEEIDWAQLLETPATVRSNHVEDDSESPDETTPRQSIVADAPLDPRSGLLEDAHDTASLPFARVLPFLPPHRFVSDEAEREYQRFVHTGQHKVDIGIFLALAAWSAVPIVLLRDDLAGRAWGAAWGCVCMGLYLIIALVCAVLAQRYGRTANSRSASIGSDQSSYLAELHALARYRRIAAIAGATVSAMRGFGLWAIVAGDCKLAITAADDVTKYDRCVHALPFYVMFDLVVALCLTRTWPEAVATITSGLVVGTALTFTAFRDRYEADSDITVRLGVLTSLFLLYFFPMHAVRDLRARRHFTAIVAGHVAAQRLLDAHRESVALVAALLPPRLARRAARVLPNAGAPDSLRLGRWLASLDRHSPSATVCVTEAADMLQFERKYANPFITLVGMCHLFTLFDVGTDVFGLERATTFGDRYTVVTRLSRRGDDPDGPEEASPENINGRGGGAIVTDVARFALWQLGLDEVVTLPLRAAIVTGAVSARVLEGRGIVRYHVSGPAITAAHRMTGHAQTQQAVACAKTWAILMKERRRDEGLTSAVSTQPQQQLRPAHDSLENSDESANRSSTPVDDASTAAAEQARRECPFTALTLADVVSPEDRQLPLIDVQWTPAGSVPEGDGGAHYTAVLDLLARTTLRDRRIRRAAYVDEQRNRAAAHVEINRSPSPPEEITPIAPASAAVVEELTEPNKHAMELSFRGQRRRVEMPILVLLSVEIWFIAPTVRELVVDEGGWSGGALVLQLLAVGFTLAPFVFAENRAWICRPTQRDDGTNEDGGDASATVDAEHFDHSVALLLVAQALLMGSLWLKGPSLIRNDPVFLIAILVAVFAWKLVDGYPYMIACGLVNAFIVIPGVSVALGPGVEARLEAVFLCGIVVAIVTLFVVYLLHEHRGQFASIHASARQTANLRAASERVKHVASSMLPRHALTRAATLLENHRRMLLKPAGQENQLDATDADAQLEELAGVLRDNHGDTQVDRYHELVVLHIRLPPAPDASGGWSASERAANDDPLTAAWPAVCAALSKANEAFSDPLLAALREATTKKTSPSSRKSERSAGSPLDQGSPRHTFDSADPSPMPSMNAGGGDGDQHEQEQELAQHSPLPHLATSNTDVMAQGLTEVAAARDDAAGAGNGAAADNAAGDEDGSNSIEILPGEAAVTLRLVAHSPDSVVIAGPFVASRSRSRKAVTCAVGAAGRVAATLAARLPHGIAAGMAIGDAAAALVGRGALRYSLHGVLWHHASGLAEAAASMAAASDGLSVVATTPQLAALFYSGVDDASLAGGFRAMDRPCGIRSLGRLRPHVWTSADAGIDATASERRRAEKQRHRSGRSATLRTSSSASGVSARFVGHRRHQSRSRVTAGAAVDL